MTRFGGVDKECGCAGAGQRGRNFITDMTGFAHTDYDDAARRIETELAGGDKGVVQPRAQCADGPRLDIEDLRGQREQFVRLQV